MFVKLHGKPATVALYRITKSMTFCHEFAVKGHAKITTLTLSKPQMKLTGFPAFPAAYRIELLFAISGEFGFAQ